MAQNLFAKNYITSEIQIIGGGMIWNTRNNLCKDLRRTGYQGTSISLEVIHLTHYLLAGYKWMLFHYRPHNHLQHIATLPCLAFYVLARSFRFPLSSTTNQENIRAKGCCVNKLTDSGTAPISGAMKLNTH